MSASIKLYRKLCFVAVKINDVPAKRMLSAKLKTNQTAISQ